ncbi:D-xylose ABC transporter ATP-binding protein [Candidatus Epulonipiscioides gigas]|nr:D-xylose ABC transporter ATP-binding protein [Epulopiscium sp. SCG-C07WGA-EpuloA2]
MKNITKIFPGVKALDNVTLDLNQGEVHALCGENGAGKSTLMKILSGVHQASEGTIFIEGNQVYLNGTKSAQELGISIIFQEFNLCEHLSISDNIWLDRQPQKFGLINDRKMHKMTSEILKELGISINPKTPVSELSVAQQQMVEIAKAISFDSKILVLDEPTAALTDSEIDSLFEVILKLKRKGVGMFYISHRLEELSRITDRVSIIRDGQYIATKIFKDISIDEIIALMVGRSLEDKYPKFDRIIGETRLYVKEIKNSKIHIKDFEVKSGEILALAGLMDAGRTEFARALFGADSTDIKDVILDGQSVNFAEPEKSIKLGLGYITEDRKKDGLALNMSVEENINLANIPNLTTKGFVSNYKAKENARKYIENIHIKTPSMYQKAGNLSGGNQQKIVLAKWICNDIKVLIFDEPTRGIDVGAKYEVYELMNKLSSENVAIIMISSELPEVLGMSDRILVMQGGQIRGELETKIATQEQILNLAI